MKVRPYSAWISWMFIGVMGALGVTGLLQMPLAKRYYLTDVPGLAWTGDFFFVHKLHYLFAAALLFLVALVVANWLLKWKERLTLTRLGMVRVVLLGGLLVSGLLRVYRNMPGVTLDPSLILVIEWTHLGLTVIMGVAALVAVCVRVSAYAVWR
ncbi:4Fe-4S ferredoxin [Pseudodesulfovibrio sp. JC047]|uniref:4Fe-4S ferredoxin n=1 Tax=Pseudodesulfovibrio sp. JC047 TaxID=2683199 RepID=UPI0013CFDA43|nr:4Fe-4S ferredoxin [Pseudodesulfovibrio sp. JC047]NDV19900.1 4Fe-4S ferredoxin [Pseudodesulfovibrio sp. JC047]